MLDDVSQKAEDEGLLEKILYLKLDVKGRLRSQPRQSASESTEGSRCIQSACLLFFLDVGQYSPSNPTDDRKREARSDIKKGSNVTPFTFAGFSS